MTPFLIVLAAAAAVGWGVWSYLQDAKRRQALQMFCASKGWTYAAEDDSLDVPLDGHPVRRRRPPAGPERVTGTDRGRAVRGLRLPVRHREHRLAGRTTRTTHHFAVVALALPTVLPPPRRWCPRALLGRAAAAVGLEQRHRAGVRGLQPAVHRARPAAQVRLRRADPAHHAGAARGTRRRPGGSRCPTWSRGGRAPIGPVDVLARLATLRQVVDGVPSFVWKDNG